MHLQVKKKNKISESFTKEVSAIKQNEKTNTNRKRTENESSLSFLLSAQLKISEKQDAGMSRLKETAMSARCVSCAAITDQKRP